ncbi:hypothetical protein HMPREF1861_02271 [Corynebacterium kroppenstedtii]|nr:hypothetical protein HMPREF1861_02271 [Corynebacterium kroppenstedtii]
MEDAIALKIWGAMRSITTVSRMSSRSLSRRTRTPKKERSVTSRQIWELGEYGRGQACAINAEHPVLFHECDYRSILKFKLGDYGVNPVNTGCSVGQKKLTGTSRNGRFEK